MVSAAVEKAMAAIQIPKDGAPGLNGKDGVGLAGALLDRAGNLVLDADRRIDPRPRSGHRQGWRAAARTVATGSRLTDFEAEKKDPRTAVLELFTSGEMRAVLMNWISRP